MQRGNYNFKSLRKQLQIKNYNFKSKTDTEVILKGYIEWKEEVIKLNGMFAFVIWDNKKKNYFVQEIDMALSLFIIPKIQNHLSFHLRVGSVKK